MTRKSDDLVIANSLSPEGQALLTSRLVRKSVAGHQQVIERGDPVSGAYFVLKGALRVFTFGASGREATLYRIEPGETCILALNALFNDVLYPAWVEAEVDTILGILPGSTYRTLFTQEEAIQDLTIRALSSTVFGLMSSLEQRSVQTVDQRLIGYLLLTASSDGCINNTQQEIADRIGTTREVVGRHMAHFASKGWLKSAGGSITLLDIPALNHMAEI